MYLGCHHEVFLVQVEVGVGVYDVPKGFVFRGPRLLFTLVKLVLLNFFYFYCPFTGSFD